MSCPSLRWSIDGNAQQIRSPLLALHTSDTKTTKPCREPVASGEMAKAKDLVEAIRVLKRVDQLHPYLGRMAVVRFRRVALVVLHQCPHSPEARHWWSTTSATRRGFPALRGGFGLPNRERCE